MEPPTQLITTFLSVTLTIAQLEPAHFEQQAGYAQELIICRSQIKTAKCHDIAKAT